MPDASTPLCRFEVIVGTTTGTSPRRAGDYFSIKLSLPTAVTSELDPAAVFYTRAGVLASGNLTVD